MLLAKLLLWTITTASSCLMYTTSTVCVVCDSRSNEGCGDPFKPNEYMREMECHSGSCKKITSIAKVDADRIFVIRSCDPLPEPEYCEDQVFTTWYGNIPSTVCSCRSHLCNKAAKHSTDVSLTTTLVVACLCFLLSRTLLS